MTDAEIKRLIEKGRKQEVTRLCLALGGLIFLAVWGWCWLT